MEKELKKNFPLLSIIVPVFNNIKGIQKIYDKYSSNKKIELIIIDDGSDNSNKINSREFNLCKVIRQSNKGVSNARNKGISKSNGKYLTFLDSDDQITEIEEILHFLSKPLNKTSIIFFPIIKSYSNGINEVCFSPNLPYRGYVAGKIVRRDFLKEHNFKFNEKLEICEDSIFWSKILIKSKKTLWIKKSSYLYCQNNNQTLTIEKILQLVLVLFLLVSAIIFSENNKNFIKQDFKGILIYFLIETKNKFNGK